MKTRTLLQLTMVALLASGLVACGNRGKLKSPSQVAQAEAKKARNHRDVAEESPDVNESPESPQVPDSGMAPTSSESGSH